MYFCATTIQNSDMMTRFSFVLFALISLLLTACQDKQKVVSNTENGTSVPLSYAQGFGITHSSGYTTITVYNPWKPGEIYDTYYLVKNEGQAVPTDGLKVVIPLKSIMTKLSHSSGIPRTSWRIGQSHGSLQLKLHL